MTRMENLEITKREDIKYGQILLWQLNTCKDLGTYIYENGTFRSNLRDFINAINMLRMLLIPYIKDIDEIDVDKINPNTSHSEINRIYKEGMKTLEELMKWMHVKNLLLEKFAKIEM